MTSEMARGGALLVWLMLLALAGCSTLHVGNWRLPADAWATEGGSAERAHAAGAGIAPPLEVAWSAAVDAFPVASGVAVSDRHVVVGNRRGDLIVLSLATGSRVGSARLGRAVAGTPLLVGDLAIVALAAGDDALVAYSLRDGRVRWRQRGATYEATPARAGSAVVAAAADGTVAAFELLDGSPLWEARPDTTAGFLAAPLAAGRHVVVADDRGTVTALDRDTGEQAWQTRLAAPVHAAPARAGDLAIVSTTRGTVCAVALADGATEWCHEVDEPHVRLSGPAIADGRVLVAGTDGLLRALDVRTGEQTWSFRAPAGLGATPLIAGRFVYAVSLDGRLLAVDLGSGELLWSGELPGRAQAPAAPAGDGILVSTAPRHVTLFRSVAAGAVAATP